MPELRASFEARWDFKPTTSAPWSGKRDSNPRRSAWRADALPAELLPRYWWLAASVRHRDILTLVARPSSALAAVVPSRSCNPRGAVRLLGVAIAKPCSGYVESVVLFEDGPVSYGPPVLPDGVVDVTRPFLYAGRPHSKVVWAARFERAFQIRTP